MSSAEINRKAIGDISYDNENELFQFIASELHTQGLDPNNEENLDSYLNTKFM